MTMFKRVINLLIIMALVIMPGAVVLAQTYGVNVYVDGVKINFPDQQPFIDENNRTLVPIRFIAEEMGAEVGWDGAIELVTIQKKDVQIKLTIGEKRSQVNGAWKTFDTNAMLVNGRTMVPLRFISEILGAKVEWDGNTRTVYIYSPGRDVTEYTGIPTRPEDWIVSGKPSSKRWDNPVIKYITVDDLPHELDTLSIMGITVDSQYVNVTFKTITGNYSGPNMYLAEGNDITRIRNLDNITPIDKNTYLQKYAIKATYDTHPDLGNLDTETDITKITHFIFEGRRGGQTRLLAIENPYFGGNR